MQLTSFAFALLQSLRNATTETTMVDGKPRYVTSALCVHDDRSVPELQRLHQVCTRFLIRYRGKAKGLRTGTLEEGYYYVRSDLSQLLWALAGAMSYFDGRGAQPKTEWIRDLLALPPCSESELYHQAICSALANRADQFQRQLREEQPRGSAYLSYHVLPTTEGFEAELEFHEGSMLHSETIPLGLGGTAPSTLREELVQLATAQHKAVVAIREIADRVRAGTLFPATLRERHERNDAGIVATRLLKSMTANERKLLKAHLHLFTSQL